MYGNSVEERLGTKSWSIVSHTISSRYVSHWLVASFHEAPAGSLCSAGFACAEWRCLRAAALMHSLLAAHASTLTLSSNEADGCEPGFSASMSESGVKWSGSDPGSNFTNDAGLKSLMSCRQNRPCSGKAVVEANLGPAGCPPNGACWAHLGVCCLRCWVLTVGVPPQSAPCGLLTAM